MRDVLVCVVLFQLPIHIIWTLFARAVWWCVKVSCVHWINGQAVTLSDTRRVGGNSHAYLSESRINARVLIIYASLDSQILPIFWVWFSLSWTLRISKLWMDQMLIVNFFYNVNERNLNLQYLSSFSNQQLNLLD